MARTFYANGETFYRKEDAVARLKRLDVCFSECYEKISAIPGLEAALPIIEDAFILSVD